MVGGRGECECRFGLMGVWGNRGRGIGLDLVGRKGSLVDEGEEDGPGWGFVGDMGLGRWAVRERGQRQGLLGRRRGAVKRERGKICL